MTLPQRLLALANAYEPVCHTFVCGCACERCADREHRAEVYAREGVPNAASKAKLDSKDYFLTPWRFDNQSPPRRLHKHDKE